MMHLLITKCQREEKLHVGWKTHQTKTYMLICIFSLRVKMLLCFLFFFSLAFGYEGLHVLALQLENSSYCIFRWFSSVSLVSYGSVWIGQT